MVLGILRFLGFIVSGGCTARLAYVAATVPTDPNAQTGFHKELAVLCAILFFALVVIAICDLVISRRDSQDRRRLPEEIIAAMQRAGYRMEPQRTAEDDLEKPSDNATVVVGKGATQQAAQRILSFSDLANPVPEDMSSPARCLSIIQANQTNSASFREQILRFDYAVRECIKAYHGSLDVDSFVAPGIVHAMGKRPFEIKNRLEMFLKRDVRRHDSKLPATVRRLVMLTEDFDKAAAELPENIPPL